MQPSCRWLAGAVVAAAAAAAASTTPSPHRPHVVAKNGGIFIDGQPFAPSGYIGHAHLQGHGNGTRSYEIEVTEGLNSVFAYRGLPGQGEGQWGNTSWPDTMAFLDRAAAIGMRVLFDFSQNAMRCPPGAPPGPCPVPPQLDVIRDAVARLRDHPAILSGYLIDEPDGQQHPPAWVAEAAAAIRALDTSRPISACFLSTDRPPPGDTWRLYAGAVDVVLADIYPIHGNTGPLPCTPVSGCNITADVGDSIRRTVAATGKPVWYVPQVSLSFSLSLSFWEAPQKAKQTGKRGNGSS